MTNNLINIILATCLLFSSFNLAAEQISSTNNKTDNKAEAQFLAGEACLKQSNIACAMTALAKIPSSSPYAKLLQGELAYSKQSLDQALQLLLPLQAESQLSNAAKISLHQHLANAFAQLKDPEQALLHLLQVDLALSATPNSNPKDAITANQGQIWGLLNKLDQGELLTIRGNNTDDNLQGWIDLALAAKNQDLSNSLKSWQINYPDHAAAAFASSLWLPNTKQNAMQTLKLPSADAITISYRPASDADIERVEAFKTGLSTALAEQGLENAILINTESSNNADHQEQSLANSPYAITLDFGLAANAATQQQTSPQTLTLGLDLYAEAAQLAKFAAKNAIQNIAILTTESITSTQMLKSLNAAWQQVFNLSTEHNNFNVITLTQNITANDTSLLDIQSKINAKAHDMVILALPVADARITKPYLNAGTPTLGFSNLHETDTDPVLNSVRFVEIPFLLPANTQFRAYQSTAAALGSNDLLRWYALGVDALSILAASQQANEILLNGLSGSISVQHDNITRQPAMARFTYEGVSQER